MYRHQDICIYIDIDIYAARLHAQWREDFPSSLEHLDYADEVRLMNNILPLGLEARLNVAFQLFPLGSRPTASERRGDNSKGHRDYADEASRDTTPCRMTGETLPHSATSATRRYRPARAADS